MFEFSQSNQSFSVQAGTPFHQMSEATRICRTLSDHMHLLGVMNRPYERLTAETPGCSQTMLLDGKAAMWYSWNISAASIRPEHTHRSCLGIKQRLEVQYFDEARTAASVRSYGSTSWSCRGVRRTERSHPSSFVSFTSAVLCPCVVQSEFLRLPVS